MTDLALNFDLADSQLIPIERSFLLITTISLRGIPNFLRSVYLTAFNFSSVTILFYFKLGKYLSIPMTSRKYRTFYPSSSASLSSLYDDSSIFFENFFIFFSIF